jgi:indolepyruvate ferredoxin oxidoreductase
MMRAFGALARLRRYRGTALDVFGRTGERRRERALIGEYEAILEEILAKLAPATMATAIELARLPMEIRGFGHVKERNIEAAKRKEAELLARFRDPPAAAAKSIPIVAVA